MKAQLLFAAILTSAIASAQVKRTSTTAQVKPLITSVSTAISPQPIFGVRGGAISAGMEGDAVKSLEGLLDYTNGIVTSSYRTGYFAGAYANIPFSSTVSIEPGVYYALKGFQLNGSYSVKGMDFISANAKATLDMQYVDIPLLLKANIDGLQLFAGPQLSYLLQSDLKTSAGALGFNLLNNTTNVTQQFNRWDAGITAGIGYQFSNGFNIAASYDQGLSKVDANKNMSAYNRSYRIGIGMRF